MRSKDKFHNDDVRDMNLEARAEMCSGASSRAVRLTSTTTRHRIASAARESF